MHDKNIKITLKEETKTIALNNLIKGQSKICWAYFGLSTEYLIILNWIKELLKDYEIEVTIAGNENNFVKVNDKKWFSESGNEWLEKKEFKTSLSKPHVIETYLGWINTKPIIKNQINNNKIGALILKNQVPNKYLTIKQEENARRFLKSCGCKEIIKNPENLEDVSAVAGTESPEIWYAAYKGYPVAMNKDDIGFNLMKRLNSKISTI